MKHEKSVLPRWPLRLQIGGETDERARFLIIGGVVSIAIHLGLITSGNLFVRGWAESGLETRQTNTQVELVAAAPEPEPPPPPVVKPPPRPIPLAKTPQVEGVPNPKPSKAEPLPPEQPPPPAATPQDSIASGPVSSGPPAPGDMVSPIPATGGVGSGSSAGGPTNSGASGSGTGSVGRGNASFTSAAPDYLHNPTPEYPEEARRDRQQGVVTLLVDVSPEGNVLKVSLQRSSGYRRLDEAALRAAKDWKFKAGTMAGQPIRSQVEVPVRFRLQ
jgi:periplasmic protein TonB